MLMNGADTAMLRVLSVTLSLAFLINPEEVRRQAQARELKCQLFSFLFPFWRVKHIYLKLIL